MRHVASLVVVSWLGGCSLLYNPQNIEKQMDAPGPDAEVIIDADPSMLNLTGVSPGVLIEGRGADGSRAVALIVDGMHMVADATMVSITPAAGETKTPMLTVDSTKVVVEANGMRLAVPVTVAVDGTLADGQEIKLDVTVTQLAGGTALMRKLSGKLVLRGLGELETATPAPLTGGEHTYSKVNITGGTITAAANQTSPVIIHSTTSLTIATTVSVNINAAGTTGGPAGGTGGLGGAGGLSSASGGQGSGPAKGLPSGGTGGFVGDDQLKTLGDPDRSSGGAGGDGITLGANGGDGGGGGGSIMLVADGDLSTGPINAKGAAGTTNGGNAGGGGSGGIVVVRAGRNLKTGAIDVSPGGAASPGRARYDAAGTLMVPNAGTLFRGPSFVDAPLIATDERPVINVVGQPLKAFQFYFTNATGQLISGPFGQTMPGTGTTQLGFPTSEPGLYRGLNQLCLLVEAASATSQTQTCIEIAYLYRP